MGVGKEKAQVDDLLSLLEVSQPKMVKQVDHKT